MEEFYGNKNTSLFSIPLKRLTVKKATRKKERTKMKKKRRNKMTKKKKKKNERSILIYNRQRSDIEVLVRPNGHA